MQPIGDLKHRNLEKEVTNRADWCLETPVTGKTVHQ
ncbi:hypothetical protein J2S25_001988 [Mesobacillus stamsii]|uniref:Uncharacterized protein n=1 Tax=Mesobacillus stamsii TaxID=225347 RepID=A0ABU0FWP3_9BACI|nr:hypothetical protein [Mesobacillus stamsii]